MKAEGKRGSLVLGGAKIKAKYKNFQQEARQVSQTGVAGAERLHVNRGAPGRVWQC